MSRRRRTEKRLVDKDPRYGSTLVSQLINMVMERGKKNLARSIVYGAIGHVSEKLGKGDPIDLLLGALENSRPKVEVKSRRVGGATYQVPVEIPYERQHSLVFKWMIEFAQSRKGFPMREALAQEIIDAYNNTGSVVKKKDDVQRMAQANRAFAHLRW
ncbi:MAG: 30S ribosomal protein S7 [Puniceicoccales bacterium]|jgi:small subunit ribosomal protein S7|nr:30S ribosomal protein S7 [Puniceicoccales bacterium]